MMLLSGSARAEVAKSLPGGATVDWSRGVVIARGVGPADRHAPSPAVARDAAQVRAESAARAALDKAAHALPGVTKKVELGAAVRGAVVTSLDLDTDGSATVVMELPIEAVRVAMNGARRGDVNGEEAEEVVVIDATGVKGLKPMVGLGVRGTSTSVWTGPTLFVEKEEAGIGGEKPVRVKASKLAGGVLTIDGAAPGAGALVVVVIGGKS